MSEYWKSTPKYWCKHCKTFVRDTKLEKQNHEATPRHQGNLQRFIRGLHKDNEREEREKQRAKDEVNRLNGMGPGLKSSTENRGAGSLSRIKKRDPTLADRKRQLAQLAEMGVAVPEDYRREVAMAGDWQTMSMSPASQAAVKTEEDAQDDTKPSALSVGVRKRKFEGQEEEEEAGKRVARKGWGVTTKAFPGPNAGEDDDLDTLLNSTKAFRPSEDASNIIKSENSQPEVVSEQPTPSTNTLDAGGNPQVKNEDSLPETNENHGLEPNSSQTAAVKDGSPDAASGIVFKKRRAKIARQKG